MSLISVDDAMAATLDGIVPLKRNGRVPLADADGLVLAETVRASRDQPPFPASAMDGYAVRHADVQVGGALEVIGVAAAGYPFDGAVAKGECVRIFTGAPVPHGADAVLIQENAEREGDVIVPTEPVEDGRYVRVAGLDFRAGDVLADAGTIIDAGMLCLLATANVADPLVRARPRVALIATGDELVPLGASPSAAQIVSSSVLGVRSILREVGAEVIEIGIAADTSDSLGAALDRAIAADADLVVTLGGASVGDHDLVRPVFAARGVKLAFEKVAMRPGKPLMHGRDGERSYLGLPGNPVSSLVCARIFGQPLVARLGGRPFRHRWVAATLGRDLPANDHREEYMRAMVTHGTPPVVTPVLHQDSSLTSRYAQADALVRRPANAPPSKVGDPCMALFVR